MLLGFNLHRTCLDEAAVPLPIPFRVRASVSEPGVLAKHTIHCSVSIVYEPAMKWKTLSGDTEGLTEAKSTPEPRIEARTNWKTELKRTRKAAKKNVPCWPSRHHERSPVFPTVSKHVVVLA